MSKQVYEDAAKLIERGWCKGAYAKDIEGEPVDVHSKEAVSYCARGALIAASTKLRVHASLTPLYDLIGAASQWNDNEALDAADVANHLRKAGESLEY